MKQKTYRFLNRLVDKITSKDCPNNDYFEYYGHKVTLQSGTHDFVDVTISDMDNRNQITFSFDFWTKELCFDGYNNYDERDREEDEKFYLPMLDNEEYDQETVRSEYETLLSRKVA